VISDGSWGTGSQATLAWARVQDQSLIWEQLHQQYLQTQRRSPATSLVRGLAQRLEPMQNVLELGCGNGADAAYLSKRGHAVIATDLSEYAIRTAQAIYQDENLKFQRQDLRERFAFETSFFDVVYARLSLHYFSDAVTRAIVGEVGRVLRPGGQFVFMCKSTHDPLYGKGELLAPRTYCHEGHIRHFFDITYTADLLLLEGYFAARQLRLVDQTVYGAPSSVVTCLARRTVGWRQPRLI
jgi:SAM-dependent methyltransferase